MFNISFDIICRSIDHKIERAKFSGVRISFIGYCPVLHYIILFHFIIFDTNIALFKNLKIYDVEKVVLNSTNMKVLEHTDYCFLLK